MHATALYQVTVDAPRRVIRHWLTACARWLAVRFLSDQLGLYVYIITRPWYPVVTLYVKRAEATRSKGEHKRIFVENAVMEYLTKANMPIPTKKDLHLAMELAVREVR